MKGYSFEKFAGIYAVLAGIAGFLYALSFIIISRTEPEGGAFLSALFLLMQGIFISAAIVAVYNRVRSTEEGFALWALILGAIGALGMFAHGGFDLANAINPPAQLGPGFANLPSQIDPRGLLTFGIGGLSLLVNSWLSEKSRQFPKNLARLGYFSAALLVILYLGRLTILSPASPVILWSAIVNGFLVGPIWYIWLGSVLWQGKKG